MIPHISAHNCRNTWYNTAPGLKVYGSDNPPACRQRGSHSSVKEFSDCLPLKSCSERFARSIMINIGYMGIAGSFSDVAAHELADMMGYKDVRYFPLVCSQNILDRLRESEVDYGVLGVENSSAGPVDEFTQAFDGVSYDVLAEYILPIHHCLFKLNASAPVEGLTAVATHQQALIQTKDYRARKFPGLEEIEIDDTALGAMWLANGHLPETTAVICSRAAGEMWNLDLIEENIEDSSTNRTTFWLLKLK